MIEIKKISLAEVETLKDISIETFDDTFSEHNDPAYMEEFLNSQYTVEKLAAEIKIPNSEFYFIMMDSNLAGYLKLNFDSAQSETMDGKGLEIERIYIRKGFKRNGLGKRLLEKAIDRANSMDSEFIWLGVWEDNIPAMKFYEKMGFMESGSHSFYLGSDEQTDIIMKKMLK